MYLLSRGLLPKSGSHLDIQSLRRGRRLLTARALLPFQRWQALLVVEDLRFDHLAEVDPLAMRRGKDFKVLRTFMNFVLLRCRVALLSWRTQSLSKRGFCTRAHAHTCKADSLVMGDRPAVVCDVMHDAIDPALHRADQA